MKDRIEAALRDLRASIKRMGELVEWQKLQRQEEKRDLPPSFRLQDHLEADLKIEQGFFSRQLGMFVHCLKKGMILSRRGRRNAFSCSRRSCES